MENEPASTGKSRYKTIAYAVIACLVVGVLGVLLGYSMGYDIGHDRAKAAAYIVIEEMCDQNKYLKGYYAGYELGHEHAVNGYAFAPSIANKKPKDLGAEGVYNGYRDGYNDGTYGAHNLNDDRALASYHPIVS